MQYVFQGFVVRQTQSISGHPLFEIRRISDNRSMVEPFLDRPTANWWLRNNINWLQNQ